jgi:internalin A
MNGACFFTSCCVRFQVQTEDVAQMHWLLLAVLGCQIITMTAFAMEACNNAITRFRQRDGRVLTGIRTVNLSESDVRDEELQALPSLPDLEELYLCHTKITEKGLSHLSGAKKLRLINLASTKTSKRGLGCLKNLPGLEELGLTDTGINDEGLLYVAELSQLRILGLTSNEITDLGLMRLSKLPKLEKLILTDTFVTDAGIRHFRQLRPDVTIVIQFTRARD